MASGHSYSHTSMDYSIASDTCYRNVSWKKIEKKQDGIFSFGQKERDCLKKPQKTLIESAFPEASPKENQDGAEALRNFLLRSANSA